MKYKIILKTTGKELTRYDDEAPNFVDVGFDKETCKKVEIKEEGVV